ncbi:DNA mismatch repair protein MutL, partial [Conidiobolus coronatus NRRL 28638]
MSQLASIKKLDDVVVNRIAAGEVIQTPAHAIKELVENCLDAKANRVEVICNSGGLKSIIVSDNGTGIQYDDLPLLCQRFTTSKIANYEDLNQLNTRGFRGEALASISYVSHVKVKTRTEVNDTAFEAAYEMGELVPLKAGLSKDPVPCAGNKGTTITVEDIFYNSPMRRPSIGSAKDCYQKIVSILKPFALHHYKNLSLTVKRSNNTVPDLHTTSSQNQIDKIAQIYGAVIVKHLLPLEGTNGEELEMGQGYKLKGYATKLSYASKSMQMVCFINDRYVEWERLKRAIKFLYATLLPKNTTYPFIYLSFTMDPNLVEVNVHPTKKEVIVMDEEDVIKWTVEAIQSQLQSSTTTSLNSNPLPSPVISLKNSTSHEGGDRDTFESHSTPRKSVKPYNLIHTDPQTRHIQTTPSKHLPPQPKEPSLDSTDLQPNQLTSIKELSQEFINHIDPDLIYMISNHTWVGNLQYPHSSALIQCDTQLCMVNYTYLSERIVYWLCLQYFGQFQIIEIKPPVPIKEFFNRYVQKLPDADKQKIHPLLSQGLVDQLNQIKDMLKEYFSIIIDDEGQLIGIPEILPNYIPKITHFPKLFFDFASRVNWDDEK